MDFTTPLGRGSHPWASTRYARSDPRAATAALGVRDFVAPGKKEERLFVAIPRRGAHKPSLMEDGQTQLPHPGGR
jgi:hypothetical protein